MCELSLRRSHVVLSCALALSLLVSAPALAMSKKKKSDDQGGILRCDLNGDETPWTSWSAQNEICGAIILKGFRDNLLKNNLHDPNLTWAGYGKTVECTPEKARFRTADGTCNDLSNPLVGSAGVAFGRNVPPELIDKNGADPDKLMTPNPAEVSRKMFTREQFKPVPWLNMLAASWIQFMNHDWLTHGKNQEYKVGKEETKPFQVPGSLASDVEKTKPLGIDLSHFKPEFGGKVTLNDTTHWWDGSQIYGSSQAEQDALRSHELGRMRTVMVNGRELLPAVTAFDAKNNRTNQGKELTGFRDNWWVGLSMLHHLFVLEHNSIAKELVKKHVKYNTETGQYIWKNGKEKLVLDEKGIDEQVFQTARLINAAVMAKIHTVEWTPAILDNPTLRRALCTNWYGLLNPETQSGCTKKLKGFLNDTDFFKKIDLGFLLGGIVGSHANNYGVPFSITEEFTSVYRLHSLLPEELVLRKESQPSSTSTKPFNDTTREKAYDLMADNDLKDLFYSFGTQHPGQLVLNNFPKVLQELKIPGHGTMDLAMVDILRDRERGVPRYNQFRRGIGLKPITKYEDFFPGGKAETQEQKDILKKFHELYDADGKQQIEMIDLLVGTSAEMVRPEGFGFGETMFQIFILMASRRLMADRFFTDHYDAAHYTKTGLGWIDDQGWFENVIGRHMPELKPHMKGLKSPFFPWK